MGDKTGIQWTESTWNPVRGCSRVSPGCGGPNHEGGCYAEKIAARFSGPGQPFHGFAERTPHGGRWTGKLALIEDQLDLPLRWKRPRRIFVNSMSDLFHEALPDEAIDKVFAVMALCPHHTFQVLTKRAERMRNYMVELHRSGRWLLWNHPTLGHEIFDPIAAKLDVMLRHVWLGISVEDQQRADERIPHLLQTPAAVRFLSCEPLLGPLDLTEARSWPCRDDITGYEWRSTGIDWVIVGGESGPGARPMQMEWAGAIIDQCRAASVPCFMKQMGAKPTRFGHPAEFKDGKGGDIEEWPPGYRVREFPSEVTCR